MDVGCYDGEDTKHYLEWCNNENAFVAAFEADANNFNVCKNKLKNYKNVELYPYGLSDREEKV